MINMFIDCIDNCFPTTTPLNEVSRAPIDTWRFVWKWKCQRSYTRHIVLGKYISFNQIISPKTIIFGKNICITNKACIYSRVNWHKAWLDAWYFLPVLTSPQDRLNLGLSSCRLYFVPILPVIVKHTLKYQISPFLLIVLSYGRIKIWWLLVYNINHIVVICFWFTEDMTKKHFVQVMMGEIKTGRNTNSVYSICITCLSFTYPCWSRAWVFYGFHRGYQTVKVDSTKILTQLYNQEIIRF